MALLAARSINYSKSPKLKVMEDVKRSFSRAFTHAARIYPLPKIADTIKVRETFSESKLDLWLVPSFLVWYRNSGWLEPYKSLRVDNTL